MESAFSLSAAVSKAKSYGGMYVGNFDNQSTFPNVAAITEWVNVTYPQLATGGTAPGETTPGATTPGAVTTTPPLTEVVPPPEGTVNNVVGVGDVPLLQSAPYFIVKFKRDPTPGDGVDNSAMIWEFDVENKVYRHLTSPESIVARYDIDVPEGMTAQDVIGGYYSKYLIDIDPDVLKDPDNPFGQGLFLPPQYSIGNDGTVPDATEYIAQNRSNQGLEEIYGRPKAGEDWEMYAGNRMNEFFTTAIRKGQLSAETVDKYLAVNPGNYENTTLSKYVNAWLYGGYTMDHIWRDLKAKELADSGNSSYANYSGFSDTESAWNWAQTPEGLQAMSDTALSPPTDMLGVDESFFTLPIFQISGEVFQSIVPPIDWNTPEFKEEAESIKAEWFNIMSAKAMADTDQAKAIADNNWDLFRQSLERKYGVALSDNSREAWRQFQGMLNDATQRGVGQSGMMREARDKLLSEARRQGGILRETKLTEEEAALRNHLLKSGSASEINKKVVDMDNEDKAAGLPENEWRSNRWGLRPSSEGTFEIEYEEYGEKKKKNVSASEYFSADNLKRLYPDMDDKSVDMLSASIMDEHGNFRSDLYKTMYGNLYGLQEEKVGYQQQKLFDKKLVEEEKAYAPWTGGNPFSSFAPDSSEYLDAYASAKNVAGDVSAQLSGSVPDNEPSRSYTPVGSTGELSGGYLMDNPYYNRLYGNMGQDKDYNSIGS